MPTKYEPCAYCEQKPKVYRDNGDDEWYLDHSCLKLKGIAYMFGDCRSDVVTAWNQRVADNRAKLSCDGGDAK